MATNEYHPLSESISNFLGKFVDQLNIDSEFGSKKLLTYLMAIFTIPFLFLYGGIVLIFHAEYLLSAILFITGIGIVVSLIIGRNKDDLDNLYRGNLTTLGVLFLYLIFTSGKDPVQLHWALIYPVVAFYLLGRQEALIYNGVYYILAALLLFTQNLFFEKSFFDFSDKMQFLAALYIIILISYFFESIRKKYQEGLRERRRDLMKALEELKETQAKLVQTGKLASIGELASGVAHELNQPLTVIRGNAQMLNRNIQQKKAWSNGDLKQLEFIENNTSRMMKIIDHLRTFSRQSNSEFKPVSINKILEESLLMLREQMRIHNIQVKETLEKDLPMIVGDPNQLEQVFINLITNARDAIEESRNRSSKTNSEMIEITSCKSEKKPGCVEVIFRDSGCGIAPDDIPLVFDPFFTTKEIGNGTGLGLSISYGIIKEHNGEIDILETGPKGTSVKIEFPLPKNYNEHQNKTD